MGCSRTQPTIKEVKVWWGSKQDIVAFLDKPEAKAERWFIQSLGE